MKKLLKGYKVRIYPNSSQKKFIEENIRSYRTFYNVWLRNEKDSYKRGQLRKQFSLDINSVLEEDEKIVILYSQNLCDSLSELDYLLESDKYSFKDIRHDPNRAYFKNSDSYSLACAGIDARQARKNFIDSILKKRKGRPMGEPKYKRHDSILKNGSYRTASSSKLIDNEDSNNVAYIKLPKMKENIKCRSKYFQENEVFKGKLKSITVSKNGSKFHASLLIESDFIEQQKPIVTSENQILGIDYSSSEAMIFSDVEPSFNYENRIKNYENYTRIVRIRQKKLQRIRDNFKKRGKKNYSKDRGVFVGLDSSL